MIKINNSKRLVGNPVYIYTGRILLGRKDAQTGISTIEFLGLKTVQSIPQSGLCIFLLFDT